MRTLALILLATLGGGGLDGVIEGTERPGDVAWENAHPGADGVVELGPTPIFELTGTNGTTATDGTTPATATRSSDAYRTDCSGGVNSLTTVTSNVIRIGSYNDGTTTRNAVQIEGSATNLATYSEDFGGLAYPKFRLSFSDSGVASPDPSKNWQAVQINGVSPPNQRFQQSISVTSGTTYAFSIYVADGPDGLGWINLSTSDTGTPDAYFDIVTGVVGTESNATGYIEDLGNGAYRCILVYTASTTGNILFQVRLASADGSEDTTGLSVSDVPLYAIGFQVEEGSYASSYIPTTSASATRAADRLTYAIDELDPPYTIKAHIHYVDTAGAQAWLTLSDGGAAPDRSVANVSGGGSAQLFVASSETGTAASINGSPPAESVWLATSAVVATDAFELFVDGVSQGTDNSGVAPDDQDRLDVGTNNVGTQVWNGFVGLPLRIYDQVVEP